MAYGNATNTPYGLRPIRYLNGAPWNSQTNSYPIASGYATAIYTGDPVTMLSDGTIGIGVAGSTILGVFQGVQWVYPTGIVVPGGGTADGKYWPASQTTLSSVAAVAMICDDPNIIYDIQSGSSTGLVQTDMNNTANFTSGSGNTATGQSGYYLGTPGTTATLNLTILRLVQIPGNNFSVAYNSVEVIINNQQFKGGTGVAGV